MNTHHFTDATIIFVPRDDPVTRQPMVLLGRKSPLASFAAGKIVPPGGKRENGESFRTCAVRELGAETHVHTNESDLEYVGNLWSYRDRVPHFYVRLYLARKFTGTPAPSNELDPAWYPTAELPFDEMLWGDVVWMPRILAGDRLDIRIYLSTKRMNCMRVLPMGCSGGR